MKFLESITKEISKSIKEAAARKYKSYLETFPDRRTLAQKWEDAVKQATDKSWSTAKKPNPDAYQFQDNCIVALWKKYKS